MAYSEEKKKQIFDEICLKITEGQSVRSAIKESQISIGTFFAWANDKNTPEKLEQYACAMQLRAHIMAEEILEIADDSSNDDDFIETKSGQVRIENKEWVNRSKLRVDARKWLMSKMNPKKYGEAMKLTGDADNPIEHKIQVEVVSNRALKTEESEE